MSVDPKDSEIRRLTEELKKYQSLYEEYADDRMKKHNHIQDLIKTIDELRDEVRLLKERLKDKTTIIELMEKVGKR